MRLARPLVIVLLLLLLATVSWAQGGGNAVVRTGNGAPTGGCSFIQFYIDATTGDLYDCFNNSWNLINPSAGTGLTSLNGLTSSSQSFSRVNDTNVTLSISSATATHTFTLGWTGTLAKSRQNASTAYKDVNNLFSVEQTVIGSANNVDVLKLKRFTDTSPTGNFLNFRNAADSASLWQVDVTGTLQAGTVPYARLSGAPTVPVNTPAVTSQFLTSYNSGTGAFTKVQPSTGDLSDMDAPTAVGQQPTYDGSTKFIQQGKPWVDVRDYGVDCADDSTADDSAWAAAWAAVSNYGTIVIPQGCVINTTAKTSFNNKFGIKFSAQAGARGPTGFEYDGTGGSGVTAFEFQCSGGHRLDGIAFISTVAVGHVLELDKNADPCSFNTTDVVFNNFLISATTGQGISSGGNLVELSRTQGNNVEDIRFENGQFFCNDGGAASADGDGLVIDSFNTKNEVVYHSGIHGCHYGVWLKKGSARIEGNEVGDDVTDIRIDSVSDPTIIARNLTENSKQFINQNDGQVGAGRLDAGVYVGFNSIGPGAAADYAKYYINFYSGQWTLEGNEFQSDASMTKVVGTDISGGMIATVRFYNNLWPNSNVFPFLETNWINPTVSYFAFGNNSVSSGSAKDYLYSTASLNLISAGNASTNVGDNSPWLRLHSNYNQSGTVFPVDFYLQALSPRCCTATTTLALGETGGSAMLGLGVPVSGITTTALGSWYTVFGSTHGTAGSTSYSYVVVAKNATQNLASSTVTIATGNATLDSSNYNILTFLGTVPGATDACVYRTVGGATQGKIGCFGFYGQTKGQDTNIAFNDTGLVGDGTNVPANVNDGRICVGASTRCLTAGSTSDAFGAMKFSGVITSIVGGGTAPFSISSTTRVPNLNADLVDGCDFSSGCAGTFGHTVVNATGLDMSTGAATLPVMFGPAHATSGEIRLPHAGTINWLNNAGSADLKIAWDSSDRFHPLTGAGADVDAVFNSVTISGTGQPNDSVDISTPGSNPSAGHTSWYSKTGKLCALDSSGTETCTMLTVSGTASLGTSAIASGSCAGAVTVAATGVATTDVIGWGFNSDPTAITGYTPSSNGMLTIIAYPTANNVNFKVCNNTASSITPGAVTLNWRIVR